MTSKRPYRVWLAVSLVTGLLAAHSAAFSSEPQPPGSGRTGFTSETTGLPVSTQQGVWTELGGRKHLETAGGHATSGRTTFVADWLTPTTDASTELEGDCEILVNAAGGAAKLTFEMRTRFHGKWTRWFGLQQKFGNGPSSFSMGFGAGAITHGPIRYHWRLRGVVPPTTQVAATCDMGLQD